MDICIKFNLTTPRCVCVCVCALFPLFTPLTASHLCILVQQVPIENDCLEAVQIYLCMSGVTHVIEIIHILLPPPPPKPLWKVVYLFLFYGGFYWKRNGRLSPPWLLWSLSLASVCSLMNCVCSPSLASVSTQGRSAIMPPQCKQWVRCKDGGRLISDSALW